MNLDFEATRANRDMVGPYDWTARVWEAEEAVPITVEGDRVVIRDAHGGKRPAVEDDEGTK